MAADESRQKKWEVEEQIFSSLKHNFEENKQR